MRSVSVHLAAWDEVREGDLHAGLVPSLVNNQTDLDFEADYFIVKLRMRTCNAVTLVFGPSYKVIRDKLRLRGEEAYSVDPKPCPGEISKNYDRLGGIHYEATTGQARSWLINIKQLVHTS